MELMAAIAGLGALKRRCGVGCYTDSKYVLQGITEWLPQWKARGWRTAAREAGQEPGPVGAARHGGRRAQDVDLALGQGPFGRRRATSTSISSRTSRSIALLAVALKINRMRQIVLDTETTGLEVEQQHRIIEIGCVELVNRRADRPARSTAT